jgi:hypothetical protein
MSRILYDMMAGMVTPARTLIRGDVRDRAAGSGGACRAKPGCRRDRGIAGRGRVCHVLAERRHRRSAPAAGAARQRTAR